MKIKDVTRREVASMDDDELVKAHSQVHSQDGQSDAESMKRRRVLWEAHDIYSAEMHTRGMKHKSPLGKAMTYECECLDCGHVEKVDEHCKDVKCSECGGEMRRKSRPGVGKDDDGQSPASQTLDQDGDVAPALEGEPEDAEAQPTDKDKGLGGVSSDTAPVEKPMKNYHSARIKAPGQYKRIRYAKNEFGDGVDAVYGIKDKGDEEVAEVQAIRFKKAKFTAKEAKAWLKKKGYKYIKFEAAAKKGTRETRMTIGKSWFLLENMNEALREAFGPKYHASYTEFDLDGPAVIAYVSDAGYTQSWLYRIPFAINENGDIELDIAMKEEIEEKRVFVTAKSDFNLFAPVIKETMDDERRYALYVVYVPEVDDSQGERMTKDDVEKACWSFGKSCYVNQGERVDVGHQEDVEKHTECYVVENFVSREEGWMGKPEGTWFAGMIHGEDEWQMLKDGEINGVSIAGNARSEEREVEE